MHTSRRHLCVRTLSIALCALLLPVLGGCGGGAPGAQVAQGNVLGKIVSRDGSTADLAGIEIRLVADGTTVTSDASGTFRLRVDANRAFRLKIADPRHPRSEEDEDIDEGDDDTPDDVDVDADEIDVGELDEDELCEIEVELDNGEIVVVVVECEDDNGDGERDREGHARLRPPEGEASDAVGEIELECGRDCCRLELEVAHLSGPGVFSLLVVDGDTEASLGNFEVHGEGGGRKVVEACEGDDLPFGVASLSDLSGLLLLVRDSDGNVVLRGEMPDVLADDDEEEGEHEEEGEDEREGEDDEEGEDEDDDEREGEDDEEGEGDGARE